MKLSLAIPALLSCVAGVFASPVSLNRQSARSDISSLLSINPNISFDRWRGIDALAGFDRFAGIGNFANFIGKDQLVLLGGAAPVCQAQQILHVQQQLAIVQELTKQIIATSLCSPEAQLLVLSQLSGGLHNFGLDIRGLTGRAIGFDQNIALLAAQLFNQQGLLQFRDFGFNGINVGQQFVNVGGIHGFGGNNLEDLVKILGLVGRV